MLFIFCIIFYIINATKLLSEDIKLYEAKRDGEIKA